VLNGWEPKVDRHEGLARTVEHFRRKLRESPASGS